jgi:hypothetical protein
MKRNLLKISIGAIFLAFGQHATAQCPEITCAPSISTNADPSMCDAVVTYAAPTAIDPCSPPVSQTFVYTGVQQTFVVPAGVTSISVDAYGAQGGSNSPATNVNYGGRVQADIPVTPGTTIYIYVGEQPTGLTGGWNGGGTGETGGKGGGGASDIRIGGTTFADRVIVAGAGGGGGFWSGFEVHGGLGGGLIGGNGYRDSYAANPGGDGGTQTSSANGTCASFNNPICAGGFGFGGSPTGCGCEVYGGGGGWYGGAGSGNCRGGGGGSSYTIPTASNVIHTQGVRIGNGEITISWAGGSIPTITQIAGLPSGSAFPVGTTTNIFVAESNGSTDTCSFDVIVLDDQIPSISCPMDIELCHGEPLIVDAPTTADNCIGETVSYNCTGATTASGSGLITGVNFNPGTTTVWYIVSDASGNQDSCSFDVLVNPLPAVLIDVFTPDSICNYNGAIPLPVATPPGGVYSGAGISGSDFDPMLSGNGTFYITYSYTDSEGCTNSDSTAIFVDGCIGTAELNTLSTTKVYPNPSSGLYNVSFGEQSGDVTYSITSIEGRKVKEGKIGLPNELTIDLRSEQNGVYLLHLKGNASTKTITLIKD